MMMPMLRREVPKSSVRTMMLERRRRTDAPVGEPLHNSFGKSLRNIQTIHSVDATKMGAVAVRPIVAKANLPLSSTGGLMRDIQEPFKNPASKVMKIAHHDAKLMMMKSHQQSRKMFSANNAKAGL